MPMPALKLDETYRLRLPEVEPVEPAVVAIDGAEAVWAESPARVLHDRLVQSFAAPAPADPETLSAPVRLGILVGSVTVLWSAIGGAAFLLLR